MTPDDIKILAVLNTVGYEDEPWYLPFKPISEETGLEVKKVRRLVRALARKGYAEFKSGLWSETHDCPAGSGYAITKEGRDILRTEE